MLLETKRRAMLDTAISAANLKKYGTKGWKEDDRSAAIQLMKNALLRTSRGVPAMTYTLFHADVLFAAPGLKDYDFLGNYAPLEFADNAYRALDLVECCGILAFMCELSNEYTSSEVSDRRLILMHTFLQIKVLNGFEANSDGYLLADLMDDSFRNLRSGSGAYSQPDRFAALARVLEGLAQRE